MDRFYGFTDSIVNKTKENLGKMGEKVSVQDAMSIIAINLYSSPFIQEDVNL